ncbi:MAG: DUF1552 domain-containing protein [Gemmatimonadaceae bacterium]|nr:DUF1552 domain-containing protein [Gemmatimonadaceae bacterium]
MYFLTGKAMPRRQFLQGMSATIALPYLDAMIPVGRGAFGNAKQAPRLVAIEMVHGAAGCNEWGAKMNLWSPAATGKAYDLAPTALTSLEQYRDYLTIISNTDVREAEPTSPNEIGGDHFSWASPNEPLPVIRDPRVAFEKLFGVGGTSAERAERRRTRRSILDFVSGEMSSLKAGLSPEDKNRLDRYLTDIREVERRIQRVEARNTSGEVRELPEAPAGVPDSFAEHVKLMFDIQALAFAADITRVFSFKMGRDGSSRTYPESGTDKPFHPASHHGGTERGVRDFNMINKYHVSMLPYFLDKLKSIQEGESNMLDKTMIIYGSPMGDSNLHNHRRCPLIVLGKAENRLAGNLHIKAPDGTPMANAMLSMMHTLGLDDMTTFGDSNGILNLNAANA